MKDLQKAIHDLMTSASKQEKIDSLEKAFENFSKDAARLEGSYEILNKQFEDLNLELQESNYLLHNKVAELDIITDYLTNILDNITQGILFIDLHGIITMCNQAAESILGVQSSHIQQQLFWKVFKDDIFGFSVQSILKTEHQEKNIYYVSYTSPLNQHSELEVTISSSLKNQTNGRSQNQGLILMLRDVTEVRYLQEVAARGDRLKVLGEMAAHLAHEIHNPLGGIKGFASLLKRDLANNAPLQSMAAQIVDGTDSLSRLVDQILTYARPVHPRFEKTNLIPLLEQLKQHLIADAGIFRSNITLVIDSSEKEVMLSLDTALFKSALLNLMVNAVQAMPEGGTLTLSVRKHTGFVTLSVADTGSGIPEEMIPKLYSPFFTTKPEGNGLGLVEVQKVIQAHRGTIDVTSIVNTGTTFSIKLPIA